MDVEVSSKLGMITIEIRRVIETHKETAGFRPPPKEQVVHERMKKLATHYVKYVNIPDFTLSPCLQLIVL